MNAHLKAVALSVFAFFALSPAGLAAGDERPERAGAA